MATKYVVTGDQGLRIANRLAEIQRQVFLQKEYPHDPEELIHHLQSASEGQFISAASISPVEIVKPTILTPNLRNTGKTLGDWLKAREILHMFFTGETVVLPEIFVFTDEELASITLMPAFRPAGATNRMAVEWKRQMGEEVFEEADVVEYKNSEGPPTHELYLLNRSVSPDKETLGKHAKSPDGLIQVKDRLWIGLFSWCDADTLYLAITGKHLDPETWCWFPEDRLPGGREVAGGSSYGGEVRLDWGDRDGCSPSYGARSAKKVPLKPQALLT